MAVEIPRKRLSSTAFRTLSAPAISALGALVASGMRTARNILASRQARGGDSPPLIFPAFLKLSVDPAKILRRQRFPSKPECVCQTRRNCLDAIRTIRLLHENQ